MTGIKYMALLLTPFLLISGSNAQETAIVKSKYSPSSPSPIHRSDLLGIQIGMSPREVARQMDSQSYSVAKALTGSISPDVAIAYSKVTGSGDNQVADFILVSFIPAYEGTPAFKIVRELSYSAGYGNQPKIEEVRSALRAKYGEPTAVNNDLYQWNYNGNSPTAFNFRSPRSDFSFRDIALCTNKRAAREVPITSQVVASLADSNGRLKEMSVLIIDIEMCQTGNAAHESLLTQEANAKAENERRKADELRRRLEAAPSPGAPRF